MKTHAIVFAGAIASLGFLLPLAASASVTINSITINNGSSTQAVAPGDNISVSITATLTDGSKWKGIDWGISTGNDTPICVNTKNAKDGTRNNATGTFTETFTIKAPADPGVYNANFLTDLANNCGKPTSPTPTVLTGAIIVGNATTPPVIAPHDDISVSGTASGVAVTYDNPTATDEFGNPVPVSCSPASGSLFFPGDTTVTCNATDSFGSVAIPTTFTVTVIPPGTPVVMAAQKDDSLLCDFELCFTGPASTSQATINLGQGSALGTAALQSVTIEKDPTSPFVSFLWIIKISCFTDAAYSVPCTDWVASTNGNGNNFIQEGATSTTDNKAWTAYFTNERAFDQVSPVTFNPNEFYQLIISDNFADIPAFGSPTTLMPYYVVTGITQ